MVIVFYATAINKRFIKVAQSMMESPGKNIHHAMGDWKDAKAAYRLFDNENLQREEILLTHINNTLTRVDNTQKDEILLAIQDTSTISYTHHPKKEGIKKLHQQEGYDTSVKGFYLHSTFLMFIR
jgi:hypothetical protein